MRPRYRLPLLLPVVLLWACSPNEIYRQDTALCTYENTGDCADRSFQQFSPDTPEEYHLGFVEYDDQGQLRSREQMQDAVDAMQIIAGREDNGVLIIVFTHGWHHNAASEDSNIQSFRKMLIEVSKAESSAAPRQHRPIRNVLGLYVGWRGESLEIPVINSITFWDRKNTAHSVGQQGVTELLLKLEEITNVKVALETSPPNTSRLVVIGHSFGGAVVYASLQKILADRFVGSRRDKTYQDLAGGFGDLVVLINPAFEALRYSALYDLSQDGCRRFSDRQLPRLAILTSENDQATRLAFPAGRFFSTLFESHVKLKRHYCSAPGSAGKVTLVIDEAQANRTAVGHFEDYWTHQLLPRPTTNEEEKALLFNQPYNPQAIQTLWRTSDKADMDFKLSKLVSLGRTTDQNPYLNITVDKTLIADHNDIWQPEIVSFVTELIQVSTTPLTRLEPAQK